jgi:hypothetical protein
LKKDHTFGITENHKLVSSWRAEWSIFLMFSTQSFYSFLWCCVLWPSHSHWFGSLHIKKIIVFWDVTPCNGFVTNSLEEPMTSIFRVKTSLFSALKMEAVGSYKTLVSACITLHGATNQRIKLKSQPCNRPWRPISHSV